MENITWTDHVKKEEGLQRVNVERNSIQTLNKGMITGLVTSCVGIVF
jgi:hypothetical protein